MTMHSEIPDDLGEPLDQHSDTLDGIRHRAYREQSREDTVGIMICDKDRLFVEGIAALIGQWDEFELLAKIYSYDDALAAAKEHLPAVVLLGARVGRHAVRAGYPRYPRFRSWRLHHGVGVIGRFP